MRTDIVLAVVAATTLACDPREPAPVVPGRDAAMSMLDAGPIFRPLDGGIDAGPVADSGAIDLDGGDAGDGGATAVPTIDGVLGDPAWAAALERTASVTPIAPFEGDRLTRLLALRTRTHLYLAVEGTIESGHALAIYVDADFGSDVGVLLSSGTELDDLDGTLDRALSASLFSMLAGSLRPDYAWGTAAMPHTPVGSDDVAGWRVLATSPLAFTTLTAGNLTACSATACETAIPLGTGGIEGAGAIAIFARAVDATGSLSNQTIPVESDPSFVTTVLLVPDPATLDGGT